MQVVLACLSSIDFSMTLPIIWMFSSETILFYVRPLKQRTKRSFSMSLIRSQSIFWSASSRMLPSVASLRRLNKVISPSGSLMQFALWLASAPQSTTAEQSTKSALTAAFFTPLLASASYRMASRRCSLRNCRRMDRQSSLSVNQTSIVTASAFKLTSTAGSFI